jgi:hypothetical protein
MAMIIFLFKYFNKFYKLLIFLFFMNKKIICQSCAMPMKKEEDHGTNRDGSYNDDYCKFCFSKGKFTDEGITLNKKIEKLVSIGVSQLGMKEEQARMMAETQLPNLKRWK